MNVTRIPRKDIKALRSFTRIYVLAEGQTFYETPRAYEIWNENPLRRLKRLPKKIF